MVSWPKFKVLWKFRSAIHCIAKKDTENDPSGLRLDPTRFFISLNGFFVPLEVLLLPLTFGGVFIPLNCFSFPLGGFFLPLISGVAVRGGASALLLVCARSIQCTGSRSGSHLLEAPYLGLPGGLGIDHNTFTLFSWVARDATRRPT